MQLLTRTIAPGDSTLTNTTTDTPKTTISLLKVLENSQKKESRTRSDTASAAMQAFVIAGLFVKELPEMVQGVPYIQTVSSLIAYIVQANEVRAYFPSYTP